MGKLKIYWQNKKAFLLGLLGVVTLLVFVVGATYTYFAAQGGNTANANLNVTIGTTDSLVFEVGKPINITADQETFAEGKGNAVGATTAKAILKAGTNHTATYTYNIYFLINTNNFEYTTSSKKTELMLKVTDPKGNLVTSIEGLKYDSVLQGFDITGKSGNVALVDNYEISTNSEKIDEWHFEVSLINLDTNQNVNTGKTFNAKILIQQNEKKIIHSFADVCYNGDNLANCMKTYANTYAYNDSKIIHHDGSYGNDANDGSYRYSGNNTYLMEEVKSDEWGVINYENQNIFYSKKDDKLNQLVEVYNKALTSGMNSLTSEEQAKLAWLNDGTITTNNFSEFTIAYSNELDLSSLDVDSFLDYANANSKTSYDSTIIEKLYISKDLLSNASSDFNLYYYKGDEDASEVAALVNKKANNPDSFTNEDNSRLLEIFFSDTMNSFFSSSSAIMNDAYSRGLVQENVVTNNINNYVCFGDDCKNPNNLYRIIGVFDNEVKLIKATTTVSGAWPYIDNLRNDIIAPASFENISEFWSSKVSVHSWLGLEIGPTGDTAKNYFDAESTSKEIFDSKFGLSYVSDFMYGANYNEWDSYHESWLFGPGNEWTIDTQGIQDDNVIYTMIYTSGYSFDIGASISTYLAYAPDAPSLSRISFYLNEDVTYVGGTGTPSDPYRIN